MLVHIPYTENRLEIQQWTVPDADHMTWWVTIKYHPVKVARALFPDRPAGYVKATEQIGALCCDIHVLRNTAPINGTEDSYRQSIRIRIAALPDYTRAVLPTSWREV